jgi:hypothetical protein
MNKEHIEADLLQNAIDGLSSNRQALLCAEQRFGLFKRDLDGVCSWNFDVGLDWDKPDQGKLPVILR